MPPGGIRGDSRERAARSAQRPHRLGDRGQPRPRPRDLLRQLLRRGLRVILTTRDEEGRRAAVRALAGPGFALEHELLDVEDPASVAALAGRLEAGDRRIDVLVKNAGIAMDGFDAGVARRTIDVNFTGRCA